MQNLISALNKCLESENWYAALSMAIAMPDICGSFDYPSETSSETKYVKWFDNYLKHNYTHEVGAEHKVITFLSGSDCYALRCAYLHYGSDNIEKQRAKKALDKFSFFSPSRWITAHSNLSSDKRINKLQLQVDIFCRDILKAVKSWYQSKSEDERKEIDSQLLIIHSLDEGISF